ncbi:hypothetical protein [Galactobacter caseinivorans]|uniref:Uncharacterized protein n=1 Tax=Galactobacter caseinivorans TaxID=2676123 RepID=A0A496PHT6_9MICC|nr:hypothetical protein [Galactobacter caseinivorans]RKW70039.1 hypothetical protein DWQ67_08695 [Galactobacter caseinivorans]
MAKYSIDTVGLQLDLQRVAGDGAAEPTWGTHPDAAQVKSSWDADVADKPRVAATQMGDKWGAE